MTENQFKYITKWQKDTFPASTSISKIHHLKQEVDELMLDVSAKSTERRFEFADCFILLFGAAYLDGMSYDDVLNAIQEKFEINKQRKWNSPDENGVVNHVK